LAVPKVCRNQAGMRNGKRRKRLIIKDLYSVSTD
jgi:hypothetical protein